MLVSPGGLRVGVMNNTRPRCAFRAASNGAFTPAAYSCGDETPKGHDDLTAAQLRVRAGGVLPWRRTGKRYNDFTAAQLRDRAGDRLADIEQARNRSKQARTTGLRPEVDLPSTGWAALNEQRLQPRVHQQRGSTLPAAGVGLQHQAQAGN